ncbi:tetratricopeptide repeat protein [Streptomyces sp. 900116325]
MTIFTLATAVPAALVLGAVTGWSRSTMGVPTWVSWTIAAPAILIGSLFAWASTPLGTRNATSILLKIYRREGLEAAEERLFLASPYRVGLQLHNLAVVLEREGDQDSADAVYRRAVDCGYPPAMVNLAIRLSRRGEEDEAQELYRRAVDAGFTPDKKP